MTTEDPLTKAEYALLKRLSDLLSRNHLSTQVRMSPSGEWIRYYLADNNNPEPLFEISRHEDAFGHRRFRFCNPYNDGYTDIGKVLAEDNK